MKTQLIIRSKSALTGILLTLVSAVSASAAVLHVPADHVTIQAAVREAASGDEIKIGPGVYTEQVVITNKNLTLSGSPGAVLRAAPSMAPTLAAHGSSRVPLLGVARADVVVSGLTLEGEGLGDNQPGSLIGIYFFGASGRVDGCRIIGFRGPRFIESGAPRWPAGVLALNSLELGTGVKNVQVSRSTFTDNGISIWLMGDIGDNFDPTLLRTTFQVNDNVIAGNGPQVEGRQFGIFIYAGARGEVKRNIISGHSYVGTVDPIAYSFGLNASDNASFSRGLPLAALQPLHIEGNVLRDNQVGLMLLVGDESTVANNAFQGTGPGIRPSGLALSGSSVMVATNRFSDMETGILLLGNDPVFGTYLGIASNVTLLANDFCDVATNITVEPLATRVEEGTTSCSPPVLRIQAIQLSWPYSYLGYSVETAASAGGSWTASGAMVYPQNGQNNAILPMDGPQRFYRLQHP